LPYPAAAIEPKCDGHYRVSLGQPTVETWLCCSAPGQLSLSHADCRVGSCHWGSSHSE
jgi:hypothetical protein